MLGCVFHISTRFIYYFLYVLYFMAVGNKKRYTLGFIEIGMSVCGGQLRWDGQSQHQSCYTSFHRHKFVINITEKFCVHALVEKELLFQYVRFFLISTLSLTCSKLKSTELLFVQYLANMESTDHCPLYCSQLLRATELD